MDVRRFESWTAPDGAREVRLSTPLSRLETLTVLADSATWMDPVDDVHWVGAITLSLTEKWMAFSREARTSGH